MTRLRDGVCLAVGTLTVVPMPAPRRIDQRTAGAAMVLAPVAALPLAGAAAGTVWVAEWLGVPAVAAASLATACVAAGNRGLHLDGLADTADGLASTGTREQALTVMRQGDIGPAGTATLLLTLLVQITCLADLTSHQGRGFGAVGVLAALVVSRSQLTLACTRGIPAARDDGLGAAVAGCVPRAATVVVLAATAIGSALLLGPAGLCAALVSSAATGVVLWRCVRRFGGVTGDVMGACCETATAMFLLAIATIAG